MPYYTLHASQFFFLDEQTKEQVQKYLKAHGINPDTTESFTVDGDLRGIAVLTYDVDPMGNAQLDPNTLQPILINEWVNLKDSEGPPEFLNVMVSSAGGNSNQFVGDGRILDPKGKEIPQVIVYFATLCLQVGLSDQEIDKAWEYFKDQHYNDWTPGAMIRKLRSFKAGSGRPRIVGDRTR